MWTQLALSFQHGDAYIYAILALAFLSVVIIFERLIMLQFVYHIDFSKFLDNLKKMIVAEDLSRAISFCKKASYTSLPRISLKALEAAETDPSRIRGTIDEETIDFLPRIESRLGILPTLATLIFLIGILGTIDALWQTFHVIDVLDTAQKQASAAQGVASALNYTAMGLLACMVILAMHQLIRGAALRLTDRLHHGVTVLTNLLVPQDMAFMPVAAAPAAAIAAAPSVPVEATAPAEEVVSETASAPEPTAESNESASTASVDDIKDEEEII